MLHCLVTIWFQKSYRLGGVTGNILIDVGTTPLVFPKTCTKTCRGMPWSTEPGTGSSIHYKKRKKYVYLPLKAPDRRRHFSRPVFGGDTFSWLAPFLGLCLKFWQCHRHRHRHRHCHRHRHRHRLPLLMGVSMMPSRGNSSRCCKRDLRRRKVWTLVA